MDSLPTASLEISERGATIVVGSAEVSPHGYIDSAKLLLLVQRSVENTTTAASADIAIQHCCLWVSLYHTGGHPLSFVPNEPDGNPPTWRSVEIRPRRIKNFTVGFDVTISLASQNDHATGTPSLVTYDIPTVKDEKLIEIDAGGWIISHGIRCGIFGPGVTIEELYRSDKEVLPIPQRYLDRPMFCASGPGDNGLKQWLALSYEEANKKLHHALLENGLKNMHDTIDLTCFRKDHLQ